MLYEGFAEQIVKIETGGMCLKESHIQFTAKFFFAVAGLGAYVDRAANK